MITDGHKKNLCTFINHCKKCKNQFIFVPLSWSILMYGYYYEFFMKLL